MSRDLKIIHVGLGPIGAGIARMALAKDGLKVVGVCDPSHEKAGKDLGDILGLGKKVRIKVMGDPVKFIKTTKADLAVVSTASSAKVVKATIEALINRGINVVTTCEEFAYPAPSNARVFRDLDAIARKKKVSVLGTGVNPGFAMDALALFLTAPCESVSRVSVTRIVDAGTRRLPLQRKVGAGLTLAQFSRAKAEGTVRHVGLLESVHMIADALGFKLERVEETLEPAIAPRDLNTDYLRIAAGTAAGIKQTARGYTKSGLVVSLDLHMYVGADSPRDHVVIDGSPSVDMTIRGGIAGDIAAAAISVNAIPKVMSARPGVVTMRDIPFMHSFNKDEARNPPRK
jgi:4-hydroxy-tetrahydrodipicolinate reductase